MSALSDIEKLEAELLKQHTVTNQVIADLISFFELFTLTMDNNGSSEKAGAVAKKGPPPGWRTSAQTFDEIVEAKVPTFYKVSRMENGSYFIKRVSDEVTLQRLQLFYEESNGDVMCGYGIFS